MLIMLCVGLSKRTSRIFAPIKRGCPVIDMSFPNRKTLHAVFRRPPKPAPPMREASDTHLTDEEQCPMLAAHS
jgi:hypothetical protein